MRQIQFVYRDKVFKFKSVFMYGKRTGTPEIYNAIFVNNIQHLAHTVELRARAIVNKVANIDIIIRPPVVRVNNG